MTAHWHANNLATQAQIWFDKKRKQKLKNPPSHFSSWWNFAFNFSSSCAAVIASFMSGKYQFTPVKRIKFADEVVDVWEYQDAMICKLLFSLIQPTFKHIISPLCVHIRGPAQIKPTIAEIKSALKTSAFAYFIRADIKSYYASINHDILLSQLNAEFNHPMLLHYLEAVVTVAIDKNAALSRPDTGITLRNSLSPFFGALYLKDLDNAFANNPNIFYIRFSDDCVPRAQRRFICHRI